MTLAQAVKAYGLKSVEDVCETTGVSRQTLNNWRKNKTRLFFTIMVGVVTIKNKEIKENETTKSRY